MQCCQLLRHQTHLSIAVRGQIFCQLCGVYQEQMDKASRGLDHLWVFISRVKNWIVRVMLVSDLGGALQYAICYNIRHQALHSLSLDNVSEYFNSANCLTYLETVTVVQVRSINAQFAQTNSLSSDESKLTSEWWMFIATYIDLIENVVLVVIRVLFFFLWKYLHTAAAHKTLV